MNYMCIMSEWGCISVFNFCSSEMLILDTNFNRGKGWFMNLCIQYSHIHELFVSVVSSSNPFYIDLGQGSGLGPVVSNNDGLGWAEV